MITIPSSITQTEFRKYWFTKFFKGKQTILMVLCLVGISMISMMGYMPDLFIYMSVLIAITIPIFLIFKSNNTYKKNDVLNKPIEYTFDKESISLRSSFIDKRIPYTNLVKIDWEQQFVMLYLNGNLALFLNQKDIEKSGKKESLLALLKSAETLTFNE